MNVSPLRLGLAVVAVAVALAAVLFWPRSEPPPEEAIRRVVLQMARAAERKDIGFILDQISENFRSKEGWSKQEVKGVILAQLMRGNWVKVFAIQLEPRVKSSVEAEFSGKFVFGSADAKDVKELASKSAIQSFQIDAEFVKEADGEWRVISAAHRPLQPNDLF